MFAVVIDGYLVNTQFNQIDNLKYSIDLPINCNNNENIIQVCVFLTGQTPLPNGSAAVIHYSLSPDFNFNRKSFITNQKPSTIFKISLPISGNIIIRIGISIENDGNVVTQQIQQLASEEHEIAKKVGQNFYNYVASFPQVQTQGVPLALLDKWFKNFEDKLKVNPQFLK